MSWAAARFPLSLKANIPIWCWLVLHAVFVRSVIARGHLRHLSVEMARKAPDVVAALTADEAARMVWLIWYGLARLYVMMA